MVEGFTCEVEEEYKGQYRSACEGPDFYGEHEGKQYCVLHFPGEEKKDDFRKVLERKLQLPQKDHNFSGAVFPDGTSDFRGVEFDNADFKGAIFRGDASFREAQFRGERTDFTSAQFSGQATDFIEARFSGERISFNGVRFSSGERTSFQDAQFSGVGRLQRSSVQ